MTAQHLDLLSKKEIEDLTGYQRADKQASIQWAQNRAAGRDV
jgi:hypothetical protein